MTGKTLLRAALVPGVVFLFSSPVLAQSSGNPAWFIPGHTASGTHHAQPLAHARERGPLTAAPSAAAQGIPPAQMQLPPAPKVPEVPRGSMPPAAVIGVISIPDVLRASDAYQAADKVISARRQKLNDDAQKEQVALRKLGQQLADDRSKLSAKQIRAKEKELQDRITDSRRKFTERGRVIQDASQYALAQIERTLSGVVQQVAGSRGMNLVLQRSEVALNQAEFDITPAVGKLLNKVLPSVTIPPPGVEPPTVSASASGKPEAEKPAKAAEHHKSRHR